MSALPNFVSGADGLRTRDPVGLAMREKGGRLSGDDARGTFDKRRLRPDGAATRGRGGCTDKGRTMMHILMKSIVLFGLLLASALVHANTVTYVYTDPQGTPLAEADANGNITATFDYAPYGKQAMGTVPNGLGYTGHVSDPDTGLVYMQARYYDPAIGRFVSTDPVGPGAGQVFTYNRYVYVNDNPVMGVDPDGRTSVVGDMRAEKEIKFKENANKAEAGSIAEHSPGAAAFMSVGGGFHATNTGGGIAGALLSVIAPTASNVMKRANNPTRIPPKLAHQMFMANAQGGAVAVGGGLVAAGGVEAAPAVVGATVRIAGRFGGRAMMAGCLAATCQGAEQPSDYAEARIVLQEIQTESKIVASEMYKAVFEGGKD